MLTDSIALDRVASGQIRAGLIYEYAQVVELVDTLSSGASDRKVVEVQVLFWAPITDNTSILFHPKNLFNPTDLHIIDTCRYLNYHLIIIRN